MISVIEIIKWPITAFLTFVTFVLIFRKQIGGLLDRTKKWGVGKLKGEAYKQEPSAELKSSTADEFLRPRAENPLIASQERIIREGLENQNINPDDMERVLVNLLAEQTIINYFERLYISIFGSQITALQSLNVAGVVGVDVLALRPHYDEAVALWPNSYTNYSFEQWLEFLISAGLIIRTGDNVRITQEGHEFLKYIIHRSYTDIKAG